MSPHFFSLPYTILIVFYKESGNNENGEFFKTPKILEVRSLVPVPSSSLYIKNDIVSGCINRNIKGLMN